MNPMAPSPTSGLELRLAPLCSSPKADNWEAPAAPTPHPATPPTPPIRVGQAGDRMLLGFGAPRTSIHCHCFLLVLGPGESDFLHIGLCFERIISVTMDDGRDELSPESWQQCELEKLTAGLVLADNAHCPGQTRAREVSSSREPCK